jgi:hypothetical protein
VTSGVALRSLKIAKDAQMMDKMRRARLSRAA